MSKLLASSLVAIVLLAAAPAAAADKVVFSLNWTPYGLHLGVFAAVEQGYYRDADLDLEILTGKGSGDTVRRVALGSATFGMADATSVILGRAKGMDVRQIATVLDRSADVVYFVKGRGIEKPKDLEGRTMGAAIGETPLTLFPAFAAGAGIDKDRVQWVNMSPPAKLPSLLAGKADSIINFTTEEPGLRKTAERSGVELGRFLYSDYGVDYYSIGFITRGDVIRERPDLVRRFVNATMKGYAWAVENPEAAAGVFVKHYPETTRDVVLETWKITMDHMLTPTAKEKGLGYIDIDKMGRTLALIRRFYTLERDVAAKDVFTMEFLEPIRPRVR